MARIYTRNSKGLRPALVSPVRATRSHAMQDTTSPNEPLETARSPPQSSRSAPPCQPALRRRPAASTGRPGASTGDDTSGDEADNDDEDDEDDGDGEDNDEKPESFAPSYARRVHKAGRKTSPLPDQGDLFDDDDDDDDDAFYEGVNDYTDSDGGINEESEEQIEAFEEQDILHEFEALVDQEEALHEFLDNIDGLSAVGYGGDLEPLEALEASSDDSGSSSSDTTVQRHVHFHSDIEQRTTMLSAPLSPLLTRALLPSALPEDAGVLGHNVISHSSMVGAVTDPWGFPSNASPPQRGAYYEDSDCMSLMLCN